MNLLNANCYDIEIDLFVGFTDAIDSNGNLTGEVEPVYEKHSRQMRASLSPNTGLADTELFGTNATYDKVALMTVNKNTPSINENSKVFIKNDGHYNVVRVSRTKRYLALALRSRNNDTH